VLSSMKNGCPVKQIGWIEKNWADLPGKWLASNWKSRIQVMIRIQVRSFVYLGKGLIIDGKH